MKAVIKTGGKQYTVAEGDVIRIEKVSGAPGEKVKFEEVLLLFDEKDVVIGQPTVKDAEVTGTFVREDKEDKIIVFKMKRRKKYRKKAGHRQEVSVIKIEKIAKSSTKKAAKKEEAVEVAAPAGKEEENGS